VDVLLIVQLTVIVLYNMQLPGICWLLCFILWNLYVNPAWALSFGKQDFQGSQSQKCCYVQLTLIFVTKSKAASRALISPLSQCSKHDHLVLKDS
jgi:hypothetical protein